MKILMIVIQKKALSVAAWIGSLTFLAKSSFLLLFLIIHTYLSFQFKDFTWLSAYGGLVTIFGAILIFNYSFTGAGGSPPKPTVTVRMQGGRYIVLEKTGSWSLPVQNTDKMNALFENQAKKFEEYAKYISERKEHTSLSFFLTLSGTLVWAYAGFLNHVFFSLCT